MRAEPHVDAADVEEVRARRQPPHRLPLLHQAQAHRALRPPAPAAAAAALAAAGHRQAPAERERRQRGHGGGAQPAAAVQEEGPGRHVHDRAPRAAAAAAQALAEHDDEDGDGGGAEADAEEDERVVGAVPALVRRVGQRVGAGRQRHGSPSHLVTWLEAEASAAQCYGWCRYRRFLEDWNLLGDGYIYNKPRKLGAMFLLFRVEVHGCD